MALMNTAQRGLWLEELANLTAVKNINGNKMKGSLSVVWFIAPHLHLKGVTQRLLLWRNATSGGVIADICQIN